MERLAFDGVLASALARFSFHGSAAWYDINDGSRRFMKIAVYLYKCHEPQTQEIHKFRLICNPHADRVETLPIIMQIFSQHDVCLVALRIPMER